MMKNKVFKFFSIALMSIAFTTNILAQKVGGKSTESQNKPVEVSKAEIPIDVTEHFAKDHPSAKNDHWRGYPTKDFRDVWYDHNPSLNSSPASEYFVVEFVEDNAHHEAMYCREGREIAIHKNVLSELPTPIYDAIKKGSYRDWKISKEKEEIFRNSVLDQFKVYKIKVQKGSSKHELFYSTDGVLLRDKTIQ